MRNRRILGLAVVVLALIALAMPERRADIRILTHDQGDHAPQRIQAAIDLGGLAVSVLITWTRRLAR